ncbi:MAG: hypothetical protein ABIR24_10990 [Verrucomicrobiota bacterium]
MKTNASKISTRAIILAFVLLLAAFITAIFARQTPKIPLAPKPYAIGDVSAEDVFAPRKLSLVDRAETELRRERELSKGPVLFRFEKKSGSEAVARFNKEVASLRSNFLEIVEKEFSTRKLDTNQVESALFRQLVIDFRQEHPSYPLTVIKGARWAQGDAEEKLQKQLSDKLRGSAKKFVHADSWSAAASGDTFRVITSDALLETNVNLLKQSQLVRRTDIVAISKVREMLQAQIPREQYATAKFLASFVEVNCVFDAELTQQLREERAESIRVLYSYEEGEVIVRRGEKIGAKIKAALDELKIAPPPTLSKANGMEKIWLWSAATFLALLAMAVLLRSALRSKNRFISARNVVALPQMDAETLDSNLMPHLARGLMNKLVRALISQRSDLIQTQSGGTEQLNELERRLEQINSRLKTRQAIYEERIAELEKELAAAEEENRELIRAKIHEARQNLEWAKAQARNGR